ncbi:ScbA/BarX family gamma-butyrolactone biosynthesis protein [Streptomyces sp. CBG33]|uniref:ScbA/BarX family gamma-butyrolactone biosynthesis protein n=1 Tax=Streptomyces sp. CBG33 TaxID=2762624 RepID=UPI0028F6F00C|nr:ScbA/BarX family gamma-butyrolactone biosynthesis protein [Streptomyces sp. CBG33]
MTLVTHAPNTLPRHPRPVPQEYTHKRVRDEVLLTGWAPAGANRMTVTARWPRGHAFYAPAADHHDPMLLAETLRQSIPLISHACYDVPLGHHLIWQHFTFEADLGALWTGPGPMDVELRITCDDITRRGGRLAALTMTIDILRGDLPLGTAHTRFSSHAPAIYGRLRGERYALPGAFAPQSSSAGLPVFAPGRVGREHADDVVLSPTAAPDQWQLRVDQSHPVLFDHPVDHVPGMLLLEAARQAAHAVPHARAGVVVPVRFESVFFRYVEFDTPCLITAQADPVARPGGSGEGSYVSVSAAQDGAEAFACRVMVVAV